MIASNPKTQSVVLAIDLESAVVLSAVINCTEEEFVSFINRAASLNPDCSPGLKEFADLVTNGKVMQDYYTQTAKPKKQED